MAKNLSKAWMHTLIRASVRTAMLATVLSGLCASAQTNTTSARTEVIKIPGPIASGALQTSPNASTPVLPVTAQRTPFIRMALLLPLDSPTLSTAAEAVRAGFFAAYERDNNGISVTVVSSGAQPLDVLPAYANAASQYDLVVGPLSRDDVADLAQSGNVTKPTIALAQLDGAGDDEVIFPPKMLMIGYSAEDEARQVATWASIGKKSASALIISTPTLWQRRAAKAFAEEWQQFGMSHQLAELTTYDDYFSVSSLQQLKARIQADKPTFIFAALDAAQILQVRAIIGHDTPIYGTSQLNALTLAQRQTSAPVPAMNGIRLIDIPWQLQPDHLAVMSYAQQAAKDHPGQRADLARLYALGIDAYRIAKEIANRQTSFSIDGVSGALNVKFGKGTPTFKRIHQPAIFRQGVLVPLNKAQ